MNNQHPGRPARTLALACLCSILAACGGGGSDTPAAPTTTVTGSAFAAPVGGARVTARNAAGSAIAGPVTTAADGSFSIAVPTSGLAGPLRFDCAGGAFTDEATGGAANGGRMAAYVEAGTLAAGSAVHLTPISTIAHDLRVAGKSRAEATALCTAAFGFADNTAIAPVNDNAVTGSDNVARRLAALRAAAFSQLARDLGLPADNQFLLLSAIASDLSDNVLDGRSGADNVLLSGVPLPEDLQNRFSLAMTRMFANTGANRTGLTADQIGSPAFAKVALTANYRIEYIPGTTPMQGRTDFRIRITSRSDNSAVAGLVGSGAFRLVPWMYMSTKSHSSPIDNAVVDNGDGTYACTVYYLMSSAMDATPMDFWELKVYVAPAEYATFHPTVAMSMGDTSRVVLKGTNDNAASTPVAPRSYFLFKDGAMGGSTNNHTFNVYLAAYDNQSTYPQLQVGTLLRDPSGTAWPVEIVTAEASTDNTFVSGVVGGVNTGGAHWSFPGLSGLTSGVPGNIYVRLFVNAEQKTTNGFANDGTNGFGTFAVTAP
jgi:hypothetical protein